MNIFIDQNQISLKFALIIKKDYDFNVVFCISYQISRWKYKL